MTDSDWVAWENKLRVTWYRGSPEGLGICHYCGTEQPRFSGSLKTKNDTLLIDQEGGNDMLFICVKCFEILEKLVKKVKEIPKSERFYDEEQAKKNEKLRKNAKGMIVLRDPNTWRTPDIQRRFLKEELLP